MQIVVINYLVCAAAFLVLAVPTLASQTQTWHKRRLVAACVMTSIWAALVAASELKISGAEPMAVLFESLRYVAWLAFLAGLFGTQHSGESARTARMALFGIIAVPTIVILAGPVTGMVPFLAQKWGFGAWFVGFAFLLYPVAAMLVLENIFRNSGAEARWSVKFLCFGLGGMFAYDFFLYSDSLLFKQMDSALHTARGAVCALTVPLLAVSVSRAHAWSVSVRVSRQLVIYSATFLGAGLYLLIMAAVGLYLRQASGAWGPVFQIVFFSGALLILAVIFASDKARSRVRVFIAKNFFRYKYDYRQEWLRFIRMVAGDAAALPANIYPATKDVSESHLHDRVLRAVANLVDCSSGAMMVLRDEDNAYFPTALWRFGDTAPSVEPVDGSLIRFLSHTQWIVDLGEHRSNQQTYTDLQLPAWLAEHKTAWLVVPLTHSGVMRGFLVLGSPRARRVLNWEDYDLLKTVGLQAASYLAEEEAVNALVDARQLEAFNRRFAFVAHDIKTLASQLSLMLQNADKFGDNPAFQKDMIATVGNSVARMTELLGQLNAMKNEPDPSGDTAAHSPQLAATGHGKPIVGQDNDPMRNQDMGAPHAIACTSIDLISFLASLAADFRRKYPHLELDLGDMAQSANALADAETLGTVLNHLLQNAIEAAGEQGQVRLGLALGQTEASIEVEDDGPGMAAEFVRTQLFRPLQTTKDSGYGIGAFQTRQLIRDMGGRLEVSSSLNQGTVMTVVLPKTTAHDERITDHKNKALSQ